MKDRRTHLVRWLVTLLATLITVTTLVTPASGMGWTDKGGGGGGSGTGNSGPQQGGDYRCGQRISGGTSGALYQRVRGQWTRWYEAGYPTCAGLPSTPSWRKTGHMDLCDSGFLVYRFYGTARNPVQAAVTGRTNLTSWCGTEGAYAFPAYSPLDAGYPKSRTGAPWRAQVGTNPNQVGNGGLTAEWVRNDAGMLIPTGITNTTPNTCERVQTSNKLREYFDKATPNQQIAVRATLGHAYWQASNGGRYAASGMAEAGVRNVSGYRFNWAQWKRDTSVVPQHSPGGDAFYLTSFQWEDRPCATPFNFMTTSDTPAADRPVVGTCYIPLYRVADRLSNGRQTVRRWYSAHAWTGYGERLSSFYTRDSNGAYTRDGLGRDTLDAGVTGLSGGTMRGIIGAWRNHMRNHYLSQGVFDGAGAQIKPLNAYDESGTAWTRGMATNEGHAADQLAAFARCRVGTMVTFDEPEPPAQTVDAPTVDLKVTDHRVLQVSPNEVQFKVTAGPLRCGVNGDKSCPRDVALTSLSWTGSLTGTGGYKLCRATGSSLQIQPGCDGVYKVSSSSLNGIKQSETFTVRFARPTSPSQAVRLSLTNLKGQYTHEVVSGGIGVRGISPVTGQPYTIDTGPLRSKVIGNLRSVTATGSPVALTKVSGGYRVDTTVVGAVQVPVTNR